MFVAFIKVTKRRHQASTCSDSINRTCLPLFQGHISSSNRWKKAWVTLITIGVWHIKLMRSTYIICQNTLLGWLIQHLIVMTIILYYVSLTIIFLNIYKIGHRKTLKMSHLRVFWATQACTIPESEILLFHMAQKSGNIT
jgi:hypothetical protein